MSFFGTPPTHQKPATGSIFGGDATGSFGTVKENPPTTNIFGAVSAFGQPQQQQSAADTGTSTSDKGAFERPNAAADPGKQDCLELLLRKLLLGEELVNTQFHLFSARSLPSGRISTPRVIWANNVLLAKSSKYFLDLLSSDINPSDPSLSDLTDENDVPGDARIDEYGYGSDSDLDDCDDPIPEAWKDQSATSPPKIGTKTQPKDDDELSDDGAESVSSDMFVMSPEEPRTDQQLPVNKDGARSVASSETAVQETLGSKTSVNQTTMRLRSLGSRHILVKDTAFQTWYTLLNYLSTGKVNFLPLSSTTSGGQPRKSSSSTCSLDEPRCSAKSMYRLACKVGLDPLRDEALAHIRSNLTENNILKEISSNVVSRHPQLLEMELDVLYSHIASSPVVENFPALVRRIINKELPHGADIIVEIHAKFLKELRPLPLTPASPPPPSQPHSLPSVPSSHSPFSTTMPPPPPPSPPFNFEPPPPGIKDTSDTIEDEPAYYGKPKRGGATALKKRGKGSNY